MIRLFVVLLALVPSLAVADPSSVRLGRIDFPVTGPEAARQHFVRGMLALHSFWYDEAHDEFLAATQAAPAFAMGYWGDALSYYHPVGSQENLVASRAIMAQLPPNAPLTERERDFIAAAKILFGEGDRETRWRDYAAALGKLHAKFPKDDEAATLYSVALLGTARRDGSFRPFAEAAALSLDVLARNPNHPGAAHYVIHAFDNPEHAILALPAARRYAQIAPEAFHALHMPSHIFVQLGMWEDAQSSNEASWAASIAAATKRHLDTSYYDFHSLEWLMSITFERGQRRHAEEVLQRGRDALVRSQDPDRMPLVVGRMAAEYMLTTGDWTRMDELLAPLSTVETSVAHSRTPANTPGPACHVAVSARRAAVEAQAVLAFAHGEAAAARQDAALVDKSRQALVASVAKMNKDAADDWKVYAVILEARSAELHARPKAAVEALRQAIALDEHWPASGPAGAVTARERLGELFLRQGRAADALAEFARSLEIHPRRSRSLLGAARAAALAKRDSARDYYRQLAANWSNADKDYPGFHEALEGMPASE